jgi:hypothetical protein
MSLVADMQALLEAQGTTHWTPALVYSRNLFKGPMARMPDGDGPYVSLISTPGDAPIGTHNSTSVPAYELPSMQVVVRAADYDDAETLARALWAFLWPIRNTLINGTWYVSVKPLGSQPYDLPQDEKGRPRLAFNVNSEKRTSPSTS